MNPGVLMENIIPIVAIVGGLVIAALGIVASAVKSVHRTRAREESRREIAAYVAEGSVSPQDAERLMEAGMPGWKKARRDQA